MRHYPNDLWKHYFLTRRDVQNAIDAIERSETLPVSLWCAWMWQQTGIPTAELYSTTDTPNKRRRTYLGTTLQHDDTETPNYLRPSTICSQSGRWVETMGDTAMRDALSFLADESERQWGWNALCGVTVGDAPNVPELKAGIARAADRMSFAEPMTAPTQPKLSVLDGGKRQELERELAGVGAHMNPVNGFFGEDN